MSLSPDQIARFEREGAVFPIPVLDKSQLERFRAGLRVLESRNSVIPGYPFSNLFFPWAHELATQPGILDAVSALLGPELLIYGTQVLIKPPRDPSFVPWHQDGVYSGWHKSPSLTAWVALENSTSENGCMQIMPGSHKRGRLPHGKGPDKNTLLLRSDLVLTSIDESRACNLHLKAGEMSLHHASVIHGSKPNRSDRKRVGFVIRFITPAHQYAGKAQPVVRVRGNQPCEHLVLWEEEPLHQSDDRILDAWLNYQNQFRQTMVKTS